MAAFFRRMTRAALLDSNVYEEVEADRSATGQAMLVVVLASVAGGIGYGIPWGSAEAAAEPRLQQLSLLLVGFVVLVALASWFVWALLTYWFGAKLFPEEGTRSNLGELLRTIGFSSSPGLLRVLGAFEPARAGVFGLTQLWMLVAMVIAVRQALDYRSTWRAVGVCAWGWFVQIMVMIPFWLGPMLSQGD